MIKQIFDVYKGALPFHENTGIPLGRWKMCIVGRASPGGSGFIYKFVLEEGTSTKKVEVPLGTGKELSPPPRTERGGALILRTALR